MSHADNDYTTDLLGESLALPKKSKSTKIAKTTKIANLVDKQTYDSLNYKEFISFIPSLLSVVTFPHRKNSKLVEVFKSKKSGRTIEYYVRKYKYNNGTTAVLEVMSMNGIPYGVIPRRVLAYITKQVKLKGDKTIFLGNNQKEFLEKILGENSAGGSDIKRLKEQMKSIFTCSINLETKSVNQINETESDIIERIEKINLVESVETVEKILSNEKSQWQSTITISEQFFNIIKERSLPIDERVLLNLESPMAIDIYQYFIYQNATLANNQYAQKNEVGIASSSKIMTYEWKFLKDLFGFGWSDDKYAMRDFKIEFKKQLKVVLAISKLQVEEIGTNAKNGYKLISNRSSGAIMMKDQTETLYTKK